MKRIYKVWVVLLLILAMAVGTAVVHAVTIIIDGVQEAAWTATVNGITPGFVNDPNEADIPDDADIELMRYTNDQQYLYLLLGTFGTPSRWSTLLNTRMDICLDIDNNSVTGGTYVNCPGMSGIDRTIRIQPYTSLATFTTELQFIVYNGIFVNPVASGNSELPNIEIATQGNVTEIRIPLASLGLGGPGGCNGQFNVNVYFDGGDVAPDDNLPNSGSHAANCGAPTSVSLNTFSSAAGAVPVVGLVGFIALGLVSLGVVVSRRK